MNAFNKLGGEVAIGLALAAAMATPAWADVTRAKNTGQAPSSAAVSTAGIDFGDDSSEWAKDGECDDPRFSGTGSATAPVDADRMKDATDCRAAYEAGTVTLTWLSTSPDEIEIVSPINAIDFGDDSSRYANDQECDDPRFIGEAMGAEPLLSNIRKDATDCRAAYEAGTVQLDPDNAPVEPVTTPSTADIDFGDDSGEWANDVECDDPRFIGTGSATELVDADLLKDATDCRAAFEAGTVALNPDYQPAINYGDDTSKWAKDNECDDPRFSGTGVATTLLDEDRGHDATDCRAAVEAGTASFTGEDSPATTPTTVTPAAFDYGSDFSQWANDGECDDPRFTGPGTNKKLQSEDMLGDATDCKALEARGEVSIRTVYSPEYQAGAPYDSSKVNFGDNSSDYADDGVCDDPRFYGPGAATTLLDSDTLHDSVDCKAAFEGGTIMLTEAS